MKKTILIGSVVISSLLFGFYIAPPFIDTNDDTEITSDKCPTIVPQCFDAFNLEEKAKIQTQVAGASFNLRIRHNAKCGLGFNNHISVALIDNQTGEMITSPQELPTTTSDEVNVNFEVDKLAYKNVSVGFFNFHPVKCDSSLGFKWMNGFSQMFSYLKDNNTELDKFVDMPFILGGELECHEVDVNIFPPSVKDNVVNCPQNMEDIQQVVENKITDLSMFKHSFMYAIPKGGKCYSVSNPCDLDNELITKSLDSFAIRPDKIEVEIDTTNIKANTQIPISVSVKDKNGNIIENYNNSSTDLKVTFTDKNGNIIDAQYAFEIRNGVGKGIVIFPKEVEGVKISVVDEHFADIDSDDTPLNERVTSSSPSSSSDVLENNSKSWAGAGTEEVENNPSENTIDTDIKQNVKKDLHYQKMTW